MSHKINPFSYRLGITEEWKSKWFPKSNLNYRDYLEEDHLIRRAITQRIKSAGITDVEIKRNPNNVYAITVHVARPGLVIGRGGKGIEELKTILRKNLDRLFRQRKVKKSKYELQINVEELKKPEVSAKYVGQMIAWDFEKRIPYRRTIKKYLERVIQHKEVKGAKIKVSGRLDGAEIHRQDQVAQGKMPLNTLRSRIDYGEGTAFATYGTVGIKVWIYFGDILEENQS